MSRLFAVLSVLLLLSGCTTGGTKVTSNWRDPELVRMKPERVMVLARMQEPGSRRMLEDQTVLELEKLGVPAVAAYKALPKMAESDADYRKLAQGAGADAIVLYTPGQNYTDVANRPGLGTGIGWGIFGISFGPLIGGSKAEQRTTIDAQVFPADSVQPVWSVQYDVNLADGVQKGIADVPERLAKQVRADGVL